MPFFLERRRTQALRHFDNYEEFFAEIDKVLTDLTPVPDAMAAAQSMESDSEMFPIRQRGTAKEVCEWIRETLLSDHEFAVTELSEQARVALELRHYLVPGSGLELRTLINIGKTEMGNIMWLQIVLRVSEGEFIWWSHD
ncbi:MAG TPA: hypothetical protein VF290_00560 [Pyrinomonadaceae bacterium]